MDCANFSKSVKIGVLTDFDLPDSNLPGAGVNFERSRQNGHSKMAAVQNHDFQVFAKKMSEIFQIK